LLEDRKVNQKEKFKNEACDEPSDTRPAFSSLVSDTLQVLSANPILPLPQSKTKSR
jgi:hypothetical protein